MPARPQRQRRGQGAGGRDPDPDAGERARAGADAEQADGLPAAGGLGRPLDLIEQRGRVQRPPALGRRPDPLVDQLAVAQRTDDRVVGRGVEGDDGGRDSGRTVRPGRFPAIGLPAQRRLKNQIPTR